MQQYYVAILEKIFNILVYFNAFMRRARSISLCLKESNLKPIALFIGFV